MTKTKFFIMILLVLSTAFVIAPVQGQVTCTPDAPCEREAWVAFSDHRFDWAVDTAERFNTLNLGYTVNTVSVVDYDTIVNNYTLAREEANYPEIVQLFDASLQFAVDSNWFTFAEDIIAGREEVLGQPVNFDDIIPVISNYYTVDGKWASVAWNTIGALVVIMFLYGWNQFLWPLILLRDQDLQVDQWGMQSISQGLEVSDTFGPMMMGVIVTSLPPLLIFVVLQKQFMSGLALTRDK
jgi:ABC-type glycerol-3-phosphate transport system substrate-binding protein